MESVLLKRKELEQKRRANHDSYETGNLSYDEYSRIERKIDREFEKLLRR